jgi:hypothetical protein
VFHLLAYSNVFAGAATLQDATAVADANFSIRNGHYILTEPYNLLAATGLGATLSAMEFNVPSINALGKHNLFPPITSLTVPANPNIDDYTDSPPRLPINEEIAIAQSDTAAETATALLWIGTPDWNRNIPSQQPGQGILMRRIRVLATQSVTKVANAWSADTALTFETTLRGGVYSVVGASCVAAGCQAFRINFPRRPLYSGRKTLPGDLCIQTFGNQIWRKGPNWLGEWGRFHTFEPPFIEVFGSAAGAVTTQLFLDLIYLGTDVSLLQAGATSI